MTVEAVKAKLSTHCGTPAADMRLHLRTPHGGRAALLSEDHRMLGFYSPQDGCACLQPKPKPKPMPQICEDHRMLRSYSPQDGCACPRTPARGASAHRNALHALSSTQAHCA